MYKSASSNTLAGVPESSRIPLATSHPASISATQLPKKLSEEIPGNLFGEFLLCLL